eukprot:gene2401-1583_t
MSTMKGPWGIIPRLCADLFNLSASKGVSVSASYVEVYNEDIFDLLCDDPEYRTAPGLTIESYARPPTGRRPDPGGRPPP